MTGPASTDRIHEPASEIKIPVAAACSGEILSWVRHRMEPDPHAGGEAGDSYQVTSLYFDTEQFDVFHRIGSFGRSKYRVRRYDLSDQVFLERKLRVGKQVRKRRSVVGMDELTHLTNGVGTNGWPGRWFQRRLLARGLKPVCRISYARVARVASTSEGPLRLTVDRAIQALSLSEPAFDGGNEAVDIAPDCVVVELKFWREMPAIFKHLIEEFALDPQPFSKYRLAAAGLGCVPMDAAEEITLQVPKPTHA